MWGVLATSLLFLPLSQVLSLLFLVSSLAMACYSGVLTFPATAFLLAIIILVLLLQKYRQRNGVAAGLELLLVLGVIALFLHLVPGFHNLKVLDKVRTGRSVPPSPCITIWIRR